jgi:hypothetical protein
VANHGTSGPATSAPGHLHQLTPQESQSITSGCNNPDALTALFFVACDAGGAPDADGRQMRSSSELTGLILTSDLVN